MEPILLDNLEKNPLYVQIYEYYKNEIIGGHFIEGEKLPSIRTLSLDLKVSKTTVEAAYNQLAVEGYINNVPKRGYFVVGLEDHHFPVEQDHHRKEEDHPRIRYRNIGVDPRSFDIKTWKKLYNQVLMESREELFTRGHQQGEVYLREEIQRFVQKTRGVQCTKEQIVVGGGIQYLLGVLCSLLKGKHHRVAMEHPGYHQAQHIFEDYHMEIMPIPVDREGIHMEALKCSGAKMVYLSPSHQYPTGSVMPIDKRIEILKWAKENDSVIIEDDYDALIRYETRPIPALQGLDDAGHVIYLGSFSKILLPSIRISYMILPQSILRYYQTNPWRYAQSASKIEQLTLAQFMKKGCLEKHLRRIKKVYHRKMDRIVSTVEGDAGGKIRIIGHDSGLHMMFEVDTQRTHKEILEKARTFQIHLEILENYHRDRTLVVFTYSGLVEEEMDEVLEKLIHEVF